jgi:hypothetical protein
MIQTISDYVTPNTIIMTDQWKAYETAIREMPGLSTYTVNHFLNFVNLAEGRGYTRGIKGFQANLKRSVRA